MSPTPVREALDRLVAEGLAERIPYRGVRVLELTDEEIVDAYVLRWLLEVAAVRLATHSISDERLELLFGIVRQSENLLTLDDMSKCQQLNRQLHLTIAYAGGNSLIGRLYEITSNKFPDWMLYEALFHRTELLKPSMERELKEHRALVEAIASRDGDLAVQRAVEHIHSMGRELVALAGIPSGLLLEKVRQLWPLSRFGAEKGEESRIHPSDVDPAAGLKDEGDP